MKRLLVIIGFFLFTVIAFKCDEKEIENRKSFIASQRSKFSPPTQSPFQHNVGLCFSVEGTIWFTDSLKYDNRLQDKYTYERLLSISKDFKLFRIYDFLIAGWESQGNLSPEAVALVRLAKQDTSVEMLIGTSNNIQWYLNKENVNFFVTTLLEKCGIAINQVKTIVIGNEVNANSYTAQELSTIIWNFRGALKKRLLNIPVTVSFSSLPNQKGDSLSDSLVEAVVKNWYPFWNDNKPFVFIDPYPDGMVGGVKGIYNWQYEVTKYYHKTHPALQIFVAETGAQGSASNSYTALVVDSILKQLTYQYDIDKKTVPTFLFEAVNERLKKGSPNQEYMGIYLDSNYPKRTEIGLKRGITLPFWLTK